MLTHELIGKYNIKMINGKPAIYDTISRMDDLFSESINDPYLAAQMNADECGFNKDKDGALLPYDITVAVCPNGNIITQIVVFRNYEGYDRYLADGIVIFDDKGI